MVANKNHREDFVSLMGICLKKEKFIFPKVYIEKSLLKKYMRGVSWVILELTKLLVCLRKNSFGPI